jgi:predicted TIM-barrel fold metal-dependent hydrolase
MSVKVPPGACDTHMHFYETKIPGAPGTFLPGDFKVDEYKHCRNSSPTCRTSFGPR